MNYDTLFSDRRSCLLIGQVPATVHLSEPVRVGLPTGRLIICDPFTGLGPFAPRPFTEGVAPGEYPVTLAFVSFDNNGEEGRVAAAARLEVSDVPVVRWELALMDGQSADDLEEDEFFGYETGDGSVCFIDGSVVHRLDRFEDDLVVEVDGFARAGFTRPLVKLAGENGDEVVAFFTNRPAPEVYPTWIGRTADGAIACFVTDFQVVASLDTE
ncbi:DUF4241 domain-containing protein [Nocardiopsis sp. CC223A]|uniref:DUF4241 domain-containing protein n=1 Tax=Nocardiopsis sp. CC223A TaxID=3044051 RepID=UPI002795B628|nr:DUF4241 domain-containing protein [Nocardiopsis sp. CC223A]